MHWLECGEAFNVGWGPFQPSAFVQYSGRSKLGVTGPREHPGWAGVVAIPRCPHDSVDLGLPSLNVGRGSRPEVYASCGDSLHPGAMRNPIICIQTARAGTDLEYHRVSSAFTGQSFEGLVVHTIEATCLRMYEPQIYAPKNCWDVPKSNLTTSDPHYGMSARVCCSRCEVQMHCSNILVLDV